MDDLLDSELTRSNRMAAIEEIDLLKEIRATSWEQHSHSFKWLTGSLLAVNGGAILGLTDLDIIPAQFRIWGAGVFSLGIIFALLVAVFGQHSLQRSFAPLQRQIGYWRSVASDGNRDLEVEDRLNKELGSSSLVSLVARGCGWLAGLAFVIGLIICGAGFANGTSHPELATKHQSAQSLTK